MTEILEVDPQGVLHLPPEVLGHAKPRTRYVVESQGSILVLRPEKEPPFWQTAMPKERADAFRQWASSHETGPGLSDETLRREHIYE